MSPDPPREDSGDDENRLRSFNGDFIEGIMDEEFFIVPDAPYELDMENESDYTDTDEEEGASQSSRNTATEAHFVIEGQGRGRYRLLIPFPQPTSSDNTEENAGAASTGADNSGTGNTLGDEPSALDTNSNQQAPIPNSNPSSEESAESVEPMPSRSNDNESKREIEMTDEKVETIMKVMKNITLPAASIPRWAAEVEEDVWKKKLYDSITPTTAKSHPNRNNDHSNATDSVGDKR